ncbi:DNA-3-methyladenine glycosylase [Pedobacter mucosus]|uniref:DNA-3-methyladenine glycosylase n=1 Tax=Pedobacter mucosus TaxID=2895286 RepID=UPI001EE43C12|nr:DNA-3-methyladenine glycosylase [Pedobacter mucosus]UKT65525.1 DNA-3-methyladenine glycosylase [Pedobacter mucosus]
MKISLDYFLNDDVIFVAKNLLGKVLFTNINGEITSGIITETEAYFGIKDKASHAYGNRRTNRTETMYNNGGVAYVYLCYGMHHLFNIVTSKEGDPNAVLIRGIEPLVGIDIIEQRRNMPVGKSAISSGPGSASKALGINKSFNSRSLVGNDIWLEDHNMKLDDDQIVCAPRIGIAYAQEHALLPLRFYIKGNKYVSKPNR